MMDISVLASTSPQSLCLPSGHANMLKIFTPRRPLGWRRPHRKAFVFRRETPTCLGFSRPAGVFVGAVLPAKPLSSVKSRQPAQDFPDLPAPMNGKNEEPCILAYIHILLFLRLVLPSRDQRFRLRSSRRHRVSLATYSSSIQASLRSLSSELYLSQEGACRSRPRPITLRLRLGFLGVPCGLRLDCSDFAYARLRRRAHVSTCIVQANISTGVASSKV